MYIQPIVGIPKDGKQTIALQDKSGVVRQIVSTPEQVDEFLKERQKYLSFNKSYILPSIFGAGIGAVGGYLAKIKSIPELGFLAFFGTACCAFLNACHQYYKCDKADQKFIEQNQNI